MGFFFDKLIVAQLLMEFPTFYGTQMLQCIFNKINRFLSIHIQIQSVHNTSPYAIYIHFAQPTSPSDGYCTIAVNCGVTAFGS